MTKPRMFLLGVLLALSPCIVRGVPPEDRARVVRRADRGVGLTTPAVVAHVRFVQVNDQGEEIPGGEHRDATLLLYMDPAESDGAPAPPGLVTPDLRGLTWYLVANYAPEGARCDPAQPSVLMLSNAAFSLDCANEDGAPGN
ncbi:MAG: hypothetical protein ACM3SU_05635 [Acidobacteriota bacterium]